MVWSRYSRYSRYSRGTWRLISVLLAAEDHEEPGVEGGQVRGEDGPALRPQQPPLCPAVEAVLSSPLSLLSQSQLY